MRRQNKSLYFLYNKEKLELNLLFSLTCVEKYFILKSNLINLVYVYMKILACFNL